MKEFKAGDLVYFPCKSLSIHKLIDYDDDEKVWELALDDKSYEIFTRQGCVLSSDRQPSLFHATPENHALLEALYGVEFEKPKTKPTSRDIIEHLLTKQKYVPCYVSNCFYEPKTGDYDDVDFVKGVADIETPFICRHADWKYATPFSITTGEIIMEIDDE